MNPLNILTLVIFFSAFCQLHVPPGDSAVSDMGTRMGIFLTCDDTHLSNWAVRSIDVNKKQAKMWSVSELGFLLVDGKGA